MTVHLLNCSTLDRFSDFPELWHELTWDNKGLKYPQVAKVNITLQNKIGSLHKVTSCIRKTNSNIVDIKIHKRSEDFFNLDFYIQVRDIKHLENIMVSLNLEECVYKVIRI